MKTVIAFLLISTIHLYSQTNLYPDKLVSKSGNSQECFIIEVNESYITTNSKNNSKTKFFINTIDEIAIDELGKVYTTSTGFSKPLDSISAFLWERNQKYLPNENIAENSSLFNDNRRWYFSVYYFPSKEIEWNINYYNNPYDDYFPRIYQTKSNQLLMESQLGFNINKNLFITLSLGYNSSKYIISRFERNYSTYDSTITTSLKEYENSIDKFLFEIGIKYYFGNFNINSVNPFVSFDIGKQFAFADYSNKSDSQPTYDNYRIDSNESEFMEALNSPLFVAIGFGAEYAISKSLTLSGILKISYSSVSAKYKWVRYSDGINIQQREETVENTDVIYRTGLGLTFFF